jgi:chromosome partitioning protein
LASFCWIESQKSRKPIRQNSRKFLAGLAVARYRSGVGRKPAGQIAKKAERQNMPHIIAVTSQKGGGGKTTLAAHLGVYAASIGLRTVLIDLDPQKSLAGWWGDREADAPNLIDATPEEVAAGALRGLAADIVLIDTPPAHDSENRVMAALKASDLAIIPVRPSRLDLAAVARTAGLAKAAGIPARYVISQAVARSGLAGEAVTVVSKFGPIAGVIHGRTLYASAMTDGRTAPEIEPRGKAAAEIKALWDNILEALTMEATTNG